MISASPFASLCAEIPTQLVTPPVNPAQSTGTKPVTDIMPRPLPVGSDQPAQLPDISRLSQTSSSVQAVPALVDAPPLETATASEPAKHSAAQPTIATVPAVATKPNLDPADSSASGSAFATSSAQPDHEQPGRATGPIAPPGTCPNPTTSTCSNFGLFHAGYGCTG